VSEVQQQDRKRLAGLAVLLVLAVAGTTAASAATRAPAGSASPAPPDLAFVSTRDGNPEIYTIRADGTGLRRLTNNRFGDYRPAWSNHGRIVFTSNRHGNEELYVMDEDGRNVKRLTRHPGSDIAAVWSPDGRRIAFTRVGVDGNAVIMVMNADGTGVRRVSPKAVRGYGSFTPDWSGAAGLIAFSSSYATPENPEIYVVRPNGTGLKRLTFTKGDAHELGDDGFPAWSPDGRRIAFSSNRTGEGELWIMNADGSGQRRLAGLKGRDDWMPTWSGDGNRIAFSSLDAAGKSVIYLVGANGKGLKRLIAGDDPNWRRTAG
jgi:Tol biopolymer transport system component